MHGCTQYNLYIRRRSAVSASITSIHQSGNGVTGRASIPGGAGHGHIGRPARRDRRYGNALSGSLQLSRHLYQPFATQLHQAGPLRIHQQAGGLGNGTGAIGSTTTRYRPPALPLPAAGPRTRHGPGRPGHRAGRRHRITGPRRAGGHGGHGRAGGHRPGSVRHYRAPNIHRSIGASGQPVRHYHHVRASSHGRHGRARRATGPRQATVRHAIIGYSGSGSSRCHRRGFIAGFQQAIYRLQPVASGSLFISITISHSAATTHSPARRTASSRSDIVGSAILSAFLAITLAANR